MTQMRADITTDGQRILAKIPWANGQGKEWAKLVPGRRPVRNPDDSFKCWAYPLTMDTCRTFRRVFGPGLRVSNELSEWASQSIAAGETLEELRDGATAEFPRVEREAPFLYAAMKDRKYQLSGAAFLGVGGQVILGDEPGLGKTLQTLAALIERDAKTILVACPRTATRSVWERETNRWAPSIATFVAQGDRASRERETGYFLDHSVLIEGTRKMLIVNKEMIRAVRVEVCPDGRQKIGKDLWPNECYDDPEHMKKHKTQNQADWPELFSIMWDAVVLDEAHHLLASTYNMQSKNITQGRYGAMLIRRNVKPGGLAFALSGTPWSTLPKAWGSLNWCRPDVWTSYWNFAATHFGVTPGKYSQIVAGGAKVPKPLDKDAWDAALRPYYLSRTKTVAAPDLPDIIYTGSPPVGRETEIDVNYVWVDMDEKQEKAYQSMKKLAEAKVKKGTLTANGTLAEITRLRQFATSYGRMDDEDFVPDLPSSKMDWILQFMEEREGCDGKVLIASSFSRIVLLVANTLRKQKIRTLTLTGATSDQGRAKLVERFNDVDDPLQVAVIQSRTGGEAITLDGDCDELIIVDPPWKSTWETQLVSRIHRVSRIHQVFVYRLVTPGTVEEWMVCNAEEERRVIMSNKPEARRDAALRAIQWPG